MNDLSNGFLLHFHTVFLVEGLEVLGVFIFYAVTLRKKGRKHETNYLQIVQTKYHDQRTFRERIAQSFLNLPELSISVDRFLVYRLIPFIAGKNPHWECSGRDCPCRREVIQ